MNRKLRVYVIVESSVFEIDMLVKQEVTRLCHQ